MSGHEPEAFSDLMNALNSLTNSALLHAKLKTFLDNFAIAEEKFFYDGIYRNNFINYFDYGKLFTRIRNKKNEKEFVSQSKSYKWNLSYNSLQR
jgi:hypothetical protein